MTFNHKWKNATENTVFVIVLFIIGHTRNRAQGTPEESQIYGFRADATQIFLRKTNRESRSFVERMADGDQEAQVVHSAHRMEGHVPRSQSERTFDETMLDDDAIEDKENHWSLERQQDRCGTLDPFQACPDGRRAHACSSRRSRGSYVSLSWVRTPKEGPGYNWPAIPFRWRKMIGKR